MRDWLIAFSISIAAAHPAMASPSAADLCRDLTAAPGLRIEACSKLLADPGLPSDQQAEYLAARAIALDEQGDHLAAVADFDAALAIRPEDAITLVNRGVANIHAGRADDAIRDYGLALRLKPDWHLPWFNRAVAYMEKGQHIRALGDFAKAAELNPNDAWIQVGWADAMMAAGNPAGAIDAYGAALAIRADLLNARAKRAAALLVLGRAGEAIDDLDRVLVRITDEAYLWRDRGRAKFEELDFAGAIADLDRSLSLDPEDREARIALIRAMLAAGNVAGAIAVADVGARTDAEIAALAAQALLLAGKRAEARAMLAHAVTMKPDLARTHLLDSLMSREQDRQSAQDAAARALRFAPSDPEVVMIVRRLGVETDLRPDIIPNSKAQAAVRACLDAFRDGDLAAAKMAGANWSLCHLAAVLETTDR